MAELNNSVQQFDSGILDVNENLSNSENTLLSHDTTNESFSPMKDHVNHNDAVFNKSSNVLSDNFFNMSDNLTGLVLNNVENLTKNSNTIDSNIKSDSSNNYSHDIKLLDFNSTDLNFSNGFGSMVSDFNLEENFADAKDEEFHDAVQFFKDPSSLTFLENAGSANVPSDPLITRSSLYVNFDPLHAKFYSQSNQANDLGGIVECEAEPEIPFTKVDTHISVENAEFKIPAQILPELLSDKKQEILDINITPDILTENISTKEKTENIVPDIQAENIVPDIQAENIVPDIHAENIVPDIHAENIVPDIHAENVVPDVLAEKLVPDVLAEKLVPNILAESEVPCVVAENKVPCVLVENIVSDVPAENIVSDVPAENIVPDVPADNILPDVPAENILPDVPAENVVPDILPENLVPKLLPQNLVPELLCENVVTEVSAENMLPETPTKNNVPQLLAANAIPEILANNVDPAVSTISEVECKIINKNLPSASPSPRVSFGNILLSFDSPLVDKTTDFQIKQNTEPPKLYTEEELQQKLKIQELSLQDIFLKRQHDIEVERTQKLNEMEAKFKEQNTLCFTLLAILKEFDEVVAIQSNKESTLQGKLDEAEKYIAKLQEDLKTSVEDLQSVESTFSDFHKRYEQCKSMLKDSTQNVGNLKLQMEDLRVQLNEKDEMYKALQSRTQEMLDKANIEVSNAKKAGDAQIAVLKAQLKKAELKISSLESEVKHVKVENEKLSSICDDLMAKVSES